MRADDGALVVTWAAPADTGGATSTVYDVRHIRSDATDKTDSNWSVEDDAWTSGALRYAVTGLTNGVGYDVQVRAVTDGVDGPWSAAGSGTPADHGDTLAAATTVAPDTRVSGLIHSAGDADYFKFVLSKQVDVWIYTTGELDSVGDLLDSKGLSIDSNDDGRVSPNPRNFFLWRTLAAGTYYVKVVGFEASQGPYVLRVRTFADTTEPEQRGRAEAGWFSPAQQSNPRTTSTTSDWSSPRPPTSSYAAQDSLTLSLTYWTAAAKRSRLTTTAISPAASETF